MFYLWLGLMNFIYFHTQWECWFNGNLHWRPLYKLKLSRIKLETILQRYVFILNSPHITVIAAIFVGKGIKRTNKVPVELPWRKTRLVHREAVGIRLKLKPNRWGFPTDLNTGKNTATVYYWSLLCLQKTLRNYFAFDSITLFWNEYLSRFAMAMEKSNYYNNIKQE